MKPIYTLKIKKYIDLEKRSGELEKKIEELDMFDEKNKEYIEILEKKLKQNIKEKTMENNNNINLNQDIIKQFNRITASPLNQETVNSTNNQPNNPLNQPLSPSNQEKIEFLNQALLSLKQELKEQTETTYGEETSLIDKFLKDIKYLKDELENLRKNYYIIKIYSYNKLKEKSEKLDEKIKEINILHESEKLNNLNNQIKDMSNFVLKEHKLQDNIKKESEKISENVDVNETKKQFKNPQTNTSEINLTNEKLYEQLKGIRSKINFMFDLALKTIESQKDVNKACESVFDLAYNGNSVKLWQHLEIVLFAAKDSIEDAKRIVNTDLAVLKKACECFKEYVECLEEIIK